jgi:hypothetical protein
MREVFCRKEILMRKASSFFILGLFLSSLFTAVSFGQAVDLTGTWRGATEIPDQGTDEMTLVIKKEGGSYSATLTDGFGMLMDTECKDIEFQDGTLTFNVSVNTGTESMTVWITMTVDGDTMSGYWETADGTQGNMTLEREK